ncbi:DUF1007 family protein [Treponema phagedenis]|uniref:DUF1007 family protein n=1 Tax=Treponema phagedenis TaxID=162 RepID=A0A0B7GTT6_TREPH|nr:DUF1007 family protein [Treponema phagedenis]NVP23163.1 DUF1007 family protein [Treponema phagedenis]QEJ95428.1 DUF1007 family protein [Treponema phagedenis]QEJ98029.1 DUF1007 family protein [Treponema phagedenis]QEK01282.1 DUF1007 family protein [Treponema phagedenis]QEK03536.1 DUF1007 family protein [Treponema phagedenis]
MKKTKFLLFLLILIPAIGFAHPHMFITSQVNFVWDAGKLTGAYVTWKFDRFFSADIIQGYDTNKDGVFNKTETDDVYNNAFIYTSNYYYFIFIRQGATRSSPKSVSQFSVWQKDGILFYRFYVDLSAYPAEKLYFAVYDYSFFCDFRYDTQKPVSFTCDTTVQPQYSIAENKNYPVYYDPFDTISDNKIYDKWKPGLQIYYPYEIELRYNYAAASSK